MCKEQLNRMAGSPIISGALGVCLKKLGLLALCSAIALSADASPTNDNFTNAIVVTGLNGSANGSNIGATKQNGEPVVAGVGGGKTIWFKWKAPFTGTIQFTTEGSSFDTALGAYTGTNVTNLTLMAENDDVAFPNDLTSQIQFPVLKGTNYYIAVDGNQGDSGSVILNWTPTGTDSAGNFAVTSTQTGPGGFPLVVVGPFDDQTSDGAGYPFNNMIYEQTKARLVRSTGTAGKVLVSYVVTNITYTDFYTTNYSGSNLFFTNTAPGPKLFTNILITNVIFFNKVQTYTLSGGLGYCPVFGIYTISVSNINGNITSNTTATTYSNLIVFPCGGPNRPAVTNIQITSQIGVTNIDSLTNVFCITPPTITNPVPSAVDGVDYTSGSGTVTNIDYQMGSDIPFAVAPGATIDPLNVDHLLLRNHLLLIKLTNAVLDPSESTNIAPPVLTATNAWVLLLNGNTFPDSCNITNSIANFLSTGNWTMEEFDGSVTTKTARVYLRRTGTNSSGAFSVKIAADDPDTDFNPPSQENTDNTFALQPGSDYATAPTIKRSREPARFAISNNVVSWAPFETADKFVDVTIFYNPDVQFNEDIELSMYGISGGTNGTVGRTTLTVLFNDQPAGAVDRTHNPNNYYISIPPFNQTPGAGNQFNTVSAAIVQPDGKTVFAGDFPSYDAVSRGRIARMDTNGYLDTTFLASPNTGANNTISCLALQSDGKIIIGGNFTSFNGTNRFHIARLNSDGSLDTSFNTGIGANNTINAVALQADGSVIVAGSFTSINGTNAAYIARLNSSGALDTTFVPGNVLNGTVNAVVIQPDGKIVVGGQFTLFNQTSQAYIGRLNSDGSADTNFNVGTGADHPVYGLAFESDGRILVGGAFNFINFVGRNSIARLNANGSVDPTFDPGSGADDTIYTIAIQPDGNILVGGLFQNFNSTRRIGLARLYSDGKVDSTFLDTAYNQFAGLINQYHNQLFQPKNFLKTIALQSDGNIIIGGRFSQLGGEPNPTPSGGVIPFSTNPPFARDHIAVRENIARLIGGATPGPGSIGLTYSSYSADKTSVAYDVVMNRTNGDLGPVQVTFNPTPLHAGGGSAIPNVDYQQSVQTPSWTTTWSTRTWMFSDAITGPLNAWTDVLGGGAFGVPSPLFTIFNNTNSTGNLNLNFQVTQPTGSLTLGGEPIPLGVALARSFAPMTIIDDTVAAGNLQFTTNSLYVNENAGTAVVTVVRTDGSTGPVSVQYATVPGTAQPGSTNDYTAVSGTLSFGSGETTQTFTVPIVNNFPVAPDKFLNLVLLNPGGGAQLGSNSTARLTIINDNFLPGHVSFTYSNYFVHNSTGYVTVGVNRLGGLQGTISVNFSTIDNSALDGTDYSATNGTLVWNSGDQTVKTFTVPIRNTGLVNSNILFNVQLTNPTNNGVLAPSVLNGTFTNSTVTILNDNAYGSPTLSSTQYYVNENAGVATVTVNRIGGSSQAVTVNYTTLDGTAHDGVDYFGTAGTLTFAPGQISQSFTVSIIDTPFPQTNDQTYFNVSLSSPTPSTGPTGGVVLGTPSTATISIIAETVENQPPGTPDTTYNSGAGFNGTVAALGLQTNGSLVVGGYFTQANGIQRNYIARLNPDGSLDNKFSSTSDGANAPVRALAIQSDGQIVVGGQFTTMNGANQNFISRLNYNGTVDSTFNLGSGADNPVYAIAESLTGPANSQTRTIIIGGSFASVQGIPYRGIARLTQFGEVDTTFAAAGVNGTVYALAVYPSSDLVNGGKILVGGDFTTVNNSPVASIARLNPDGTLDTTFNNPVVAPGPNAAVRTIAIQLDGNIVIGGLFTSVNGLPMNYIARLTTSGQVDPSFNPGPGTDEAVSTVAIQQDLKILVGGSFTHAGGVTRNRITRLNSDGSADSGINFGLGANDFVDAIAVQPDTKIILGGNFTTYDGVSKPYITRIYGGTQTGDGSIQFQSPTYQINQALTNIVIGIIRTGGTANTINVVASTSDGTATAGVDYTPVSNTVTFPPGEVYGSIIVPILADPTNFSQLVVNLTLTDTFGNLLQGPQSMASLALVGSSSTVNYSTPAFSVAKNIGGGQATITVQRNGGVSGTSSVDCFTTTNGTATPGLDYTPVTNTVVFAPGQSNQTFAVPIANNGLPEGNLTVGLAMANPTNTVLDSTLPTAATLTIIDNVRAPGNFAFASNTFTIADGNTNIVITVVRTNGSVGQVSVNYTAGGGTATFADYLPTSGTLTFLDGQTSKSFSVAILNDTNLTGPVTVNLTLSQPSGGTGIVGVNPATLVINNNNLNVSFAQSGYFVDEKNGVVIIGVNRFGNTNATVQATYSTADGSATTGANYNFTSNTLTFAPGQTFQSFQVPIIYDPQITGNLLFFVNLYSIPGSGVQVVSPAAATVTVLDDDVGLNLASASASIVKANTNAIVSVLRTGSAAGTVSVNYAANTGSAAQNVEYTPVSGVLTFVSGQTSNSFVIPIINDNQIDGDQTVNISISSPTGGAQLLAPSTEVLTIVDNQTGFAFSSPTYAVNENGISVTITVTRSGFLNSTASVNYATSDGTAHNGVHYNGTGGTLLFTNGQSSATFTVSIIDNNVTGGSEAFNLLLSSPSANATLVSPLAATVTILNNDGSLIVPAGAAVLSPTNGILSPGSAVTVLLSIMNTAGGTATNISATLLSTNGITATGTTTVSNYPSLYVGGPSAFGQFTFTVNSTNVSGSTVSAVLKLKFDNTNTSTVSYTFAIGASTNSTGNTNAIIISDVSAATPYPSSINISGVSGNISKLTATVSNLNHAFASDVAILLVGPAGQKVLLMETNGGSHAIANATLTFDNTVGTVLGSGAVVTGTYKPAPLVTNNVFHTSTNGVPPPSQPYANTLSDFIGSSPNGTWSLYVDDQKFLDNGGISNGWSLNITTLSSIAANNDLVIGIAAAPQPVVVGSNLVYTVWVTNAGPSTATGVKVTSVVPAGFTNFTVAALVSNSVSTLGNTFSTNGSGVVTVTSLFTNVFVTNGFGKLTITGTAPSVSGLITNNVTVAGNEFEDNPINNTASQITTVSSPSADLAILVADSPNPILVGGTLTYSILVSNLGPATATGVFVTNTLPAGVTYLSNTAPSVVTNAGPSYVFNLGSLGSGLTASFNVYAKPTVPQLLFNTFTAGSSLLDLFKGNNGNTVKVVVQALPLTITPSGGGLTFTWPVSGGPTYHLQTETNLALGNWSNVTNAASSNGANYTVTVPITGAGPVFFRLISP